MGYMKRVLQQMALRLPGVGLILANRERLGLRLRAMRRLIDEPSAGVRLQALRRDVGRLLRIEPQFVARDHRGFLDARRTHLSDVSQCCAEGLRAKGSGAFHLRRFCLCCNETTRMLVDYQYGHVDANGTNTVNWRERLVCDSCGMNNRQRLVAKLVQQAAAACARPRIYLMEQVTPIYEWVRKLPGVEVHGSEYLGHEYKGGDRINGIRHEDVMNLSYADAVFDLIVSNDVLEHIPEPELALRECFRVLKPGGAILATFPFHVAYETTVVRAKLAAGTIEHLLAPQYHGNPVSPEGSLVFQDFGWNLLDVMRGIGFSPASCEFYCSDEFGHIGPGLLAFRLVRPRSGPAA